VLIVEDDLSYEPIWRKVFEEVNPEIEYSWCTSAGEAQKVLEKTLAEGEFWDLVIVDIFLSGSRTGLDLWQRCGEPVENMIIVSSVEYGKLLDYIGDSERPPIYLKKPLNLKECVSVVSEVLDGIP
jgi:response regulator of citrate/malate metabolism